MLLVKVAQQWQAEHDGMLPKSQAERTAFKNLVSSWQRAADGIPLDVSGQAGVCCVQWADRLGCSTPSGQAGIWTGVED